MEYPRISLVTACYNHADYIERTMRSVLDQGYPNLQYIVINDGSTDGSEEIIKKYAGSLHHWETLEGYRPGPVTALNRAISMTDGEIMGWLNSDDILLPNSLFVLARVFDQVREMEWLTGLASTINERDEIVSVRPFMKSVYDYLNGDWSVIQQESTFWRRSLWERADGQLDDSTWMFDVELWTRFFLLSRHYHLKAPVGAFRKGRQSRTSTDMGKYMSYVERALERMTLQASPEQRKLAKRYQFVKKYLRLFLRYSPGSLRGSLGLDRYNYSTINYNFNTDKWGVAEENPF